MTNDKTIKERALQHLRQANLTMKALDRDAITDVFEALKPTLVQALPRHLTAERMIHLSSEVVRKNPKIAECNASSILGAVVQASILGFEPVDQLGYCYLVPYKGQVQLQIGYRGWVNLGYRSTRVRAIEAHPVFKEDKFSYAYGTNNFIEHEPKEQSNILTHAYAIVTLEYGEKIFRVLTKDKIEDLRKRNPLQGEKPTKAWATDYDAMACAKVVKKLSPFMPSEIIHRAEAIDETVTAVEQGFDVPPDKYKEEQNFEDFDIYDDENIVDVNNPLA